MSELRVVLVTRRFWPLLGSAENTIAVLAGELRARGVDATVLTAKWAPDWPERIYLDGVRVTRVPRPRGDVWGTFRYLHGLRRWLRQHRDHIDLVCVSRLRLEAYATLSAIGRTGIPVVLRAEHSGEGGDLRWQRRRHLGWRVLRKCRSAAAVVAPDARVAGELMQAGFARRKIYPIANGISLPSPGGFGARAAARQALADVNSDLKTRSDSKVVLFLGRLRKSNRLLSLVDAWPAVLRQRPEARLWLVGDGPLRDQLGERIMDLQLQSTVLLPGTFEDVSDLLAAADVFVCPTGREGIPRALLEAVAARLPIVASDTPDIRRCSATDGDNALLVPVGDRAAIQSALLRQLDHPPPRHSLLAAARCVARDFSCQAMVEAHECLFRRLVEGGAGTGS